MMNTPAQNAAANSRGRKPSLLFTGMWFGGTATVLQNLRKIISAHSEVDSTWIPIEPEPPELFARVPPISLNWTLRGGMIARSRIIQQEKSGKRFDAAYFNDHIPASFIDGFRSRVSSVMAMDVTPRLMEQHNAWYGVPPSGRMNIIEELKFRRTRKTYQHTTFLLPWSNWVKKSLMEDYGVDEAKIRVLAPGVDLDLWTNDTVSTSTRTRILFVGNQFLRKGGDLLCNLARLEPFAGCDFHLVTNSVVENMPPNVIVHTNVLPNSPQLVHLYKQADIFVLPTRADFFPLAIMEAMAMKLPVVATELGSIDEMIEEGNTGYLIPGEDQDALAERMLRLIRNPAMRRKFGANARKKAEREFSLRHNAEIILETLCRAAGMHVPGRV